MNNFSISVLIFKTKLMKPQSDKNIDKLHIRFILGSNISKFDNKFEN